MRLDRLRELRKKAGLNQSQAAAIFGVSTTSYCSWEIGDYEPSISKLCLMADYFGVSVDYILQRNEKSLTVAEREMLRRASNIIKEKI